MFSLSAKRALLLTSLALVAFAAGAAPFHQDELKWLQTMAFAAHQTDYTGTFVYQHGNHVETLRITHIADRNGEHSRLENLDGPKREIIRTNDMVTCFVGDHEVLEERSMQDTREFPALLPQQLTLLDDNYIIRPVSEERVAGLNAHVFVFQPKDNLRYAHKMWAHDDSGLLLKTAVLDNRGAVIEQYGFTQLTIGGNIDSSWINKVVVPDAHNIDPFHHKHHKNPHGHGVQASPDNVGSQVDSDLQHEDATRSAHFTHNNQHQVVSSGWRVDALPDGFQKIAEVSRRLPGKDAPVTQMVYSDGLAGISVFIEKSDSDEDDFSGLSGKGLLQIYTKLVNGYLVTVVGEVPPRTVIQVADSVRQSGG